MASKAEAMLQNNQCSVLGITVEQTKSSVVVFFIFGHLFTFGIGIHDSAVGAFKEEVKGIMYIQTFAVSFYKTQRIICLLASCMINMK
jgi:hypothetical protein